VIIAVCYVSSVRTCTIVLLLLLRRGDYCCLLYIYYGISCQLCEDLYNRIQDNSVGDVQYNVEVRQSLE